VKGASPHQGVCIDAGGALLLPSLAAAQSLLCFEALFVGYIASVCNKLANCIASDEYCLLDSGKVLFSSSASSTVRIVVCRIVSPQTFTS
jgi:hypothetical protein